MMGAAGWYLVIYLISGPTSSPAPHWTMTQGTIERFGPYSTEALCELASEQTVSRLKRAGAKIDARLCQWRTKP